jgi:hypothetical protein
MSELRRVDLEGVLRGDEIMSALVPLTAAAPGSELNLSAAEGFDAWAAVAIYADALDTEMHMFTPVVICMPGDPEACQVLCAYFREIPNRVELVPGPVPGPHPEEVLLPVWRFHHPRGGRVIAEASPSVLADVCSANETKFLAGVLGALAENASTHGQDSRIGSMLAASFDRQSLKVQIVVHDRGSAVELSELDEDDVLASFWEASADGAPGGLAAIPIQADLWEVDAELTLQAGHGRLTWTPQGMETAWAEHSPGFTAAVTLRLREQDQ